MLLNNLEKEKEQKEIIKYIFNKDLEKSQLDLTNKVNGLIKEERIHADPDKVNIVF